MGQVVAGAKIPDNPATRLSNLLADKALVKKTAANPGGGANPSASLLHKLPEAKLFSQLKEPLVKNPVQPNIAPKLAAREFFNQAAVNMGFPKDTLSSTLLAFVRFFSLPVSPELLGALRRQSLAAGKASPEAKALALVSALDKGVVLSPEALERYAGFLFPDTPSGDSGKRQKKREKPQENDPPAEKLQAIAEEEAKKDNLLDFMNQLPGKNGQYWLVFPFKVETDGIELNVVLRILKGFDKPGEQEQLIIDAAGPKTEWRFFVKKGPDGEILVRSGTDELYADLFAEDLLSVDKSV